MSDLTMGVIEERFADIIWQNEPISSSELAKRALEVLNWKKSTSFTVLKRLCNKGIFQSEKGIVTSLMSKDEFHSLQSEQFVNNTFKGSLPAFLAAFTKKKDLSADEVAELRRIVEEYSEN